MQIQSKTDNITKQFSVNNESQNCQSANQNYLETSQQFEQSQTQSINLNAQYKRTKSQRVSQDDLLKIKQRDSSTDGEFKESLRVKSKRKSVTIAQDQNLQHSVMIEDSFIRSNLKSDILAYYKFDENQEMYKVDTQANNNPVKKSIRKASQERHWKPIQIPQDMFDDSSNNQKSDSSGKGKVRVIVTQNTGQDSSRKNDNFLNPFQFVQLPGQQQHRNVSNSWHPFNQSSQPANYQQKIANFFHPNMGNQPLNNGFPTMQHSHTVNCVPPRSPSSDPYWQQMPPPSPSQPYNYPPFYQGAEMMNEMRYLRQEVRMLRDSMRQQRAEKQFRMRFRSQSETNDSGKWERMLAQMKNVIESERKQHLKKIELMSNKFIDQIQRLKQSNRSLKKQNQQLKKKQPQQQKNLQNKSSLRQSVTRNLQFNLNRKGSNLQTLTSRHYCNNEDILNKKMKQSSKKNQKNQTAQKIPRPRKLSEHKISLKD